MPRKYDVHANEGPKDNKKIKFEESGDDKLSSGYFPGV
jgi:hypothetical protein